MKLELKSINLNNTIRLEAKGLKSLFKELANKPFSSFVRNTSQFVEDLKNYEIPYFNAEQFTKQNTARDKLLKELEFYNSKFWIKHSSVDFFSKNCASIDEFLEDILNNTEFYNALGYENVRLNNLDLHNQGILVVKGLEVLQ